METTNPEILRKVDTFLLNVTPKDKVCIIHDTDPDGVCSAVIIAKCVERLRNKKVDMRIPMDKTQYGITDKMLKQLKNKKITKLITTDFSAEQNPERLRNKKVDMRIPMDKTQYGITDKMLKQLKNKKITKLITTDFSAEQNPERLKELEKQMEILIIDHHKLYNDYKSDRTVLYKPQFFTKIDPSTYCTAKLAFDAADRLVKTEDLDWMAATACIADIATAPWKEWLAEVFKKYKIKMKKDLFRTGIGQVAATIKSTEVYDLKLVPQCYDVFYSAKKPKDILKSKLGKYKIIIDKDLKKHLALFEKKAEKHKDIRIYEMTSKYRIHSALSTILGLKYPDKTIIIINKTGPIISVSGRRGDKKKPVNTLLENLIKGFEGANAGGHTPAAGAGFNKKYLKTFKQRLIQWKT